MSAEHVANMSEMEIPENPFPGLRPFEFEESLLYFGRDGQSEQLLRKLSATRFLAVVGTSGSGKSSLVRAGLLPALLGGFMTSAGSNWRIALMRPGFDPIGNLARSLAAPDVLGSGGHQEILSAMAESTLSRGNFGLMDLAKQARIGPRQNLLIVADQFEELFRVAGFAESEAYRNRAAAFVKLLLEASRQRELPIYVVLTMRSDFLGDCSTFWGLPEAINEGQYLIPRLTREQRREAVTGPIAVCGGSITDRLVTRLLNDMGDDQDQLPLLQHALMRTWVKWSREGAERTAIDLEDYESIGGMSDALSMHVDEAFNSLPDDRSRQVAEKVFKGLTEKGSDNREIRRPVTLAGLSVVTGTAESELAQVIDTFRRQGRCFLMPPADVPLTSTAMIDISHESLIRNWRRLKEWVDEEARSARIYRRLAETAALYREGKAGLWRDPDLQVALTWREQSRPNKAWAARYHQDFDQAMDFLDKSLAERGAEQQAREAERRDKELRRSRQVRNARVTTAAVVVALMISLGTLVYANRQKQEAIRQKQEAIIQKEQASTNLEIAQANEALALGERTRFLVEKTKAEANAVLAERNGQTAFAQMTRADKEREQALHLLYAADFKQAYRAYRSKDFARADEILATIAPDSRGFEWHHLWNRYRSAEHTIRGYERPVTSVAFNPVKNNLLATGSADGTLALVDVVSGKAESLDTGASSIWGSIFSPDGKKVAVLGDVLGKSNKVELWDVSSKQSLGILPREERDLQVKCIAFWQAGKLVAGYEQGTIAVWDPEFPRNRQILPYPGPPKTAMPDVVALAGSPGGNILASGYEDGMLSIWRPGSLEHAEPSFDRGQITALAISPDGELLAAATKDGWLAIWVTSDIFHQEEFNKGHKQAVPLVEKELLSTNLNCLAFTEDGKMLAATRTDGAVALWNMQTLRDARSELDRLEQSRQSARNESELKELEEGIQVVKTAASDSLKPGGDTLPSEHSGPVTSIAFSRDGQTFASGSSDRTVKVWRLGYDRNREEGVISPDGHLVAILEPDAIKILEDGKLRSSLALDARRKVSYLAFSPDNRAIVARLEDDTIKVFDPRGGEKMELSKGAREVSSNARFVAEWDGEVVRVWDTSRGAVSHVFLPPAPSTTHSLCFSPDSKKVAVGYSDGTAKLYYLETAEELEIAKMGEGDERVRFSPDSKFLEMFSERGRRTTQHATDGHVLSKTWNVKERRMAIKDELSRGQLEKVEAPLTVRSLANGKIASAQGESIVLSDGTKQTITQRAHLGQVTALDFSPNGRTLASGGLDGTVKLWDAKSLEYLSEIASLKKTNGSLNPVASLAFSRDGKRLAMGTDSGEGTLVLWDIAARQELLRLPERLPKASTFSAGDEALGSHTLGRIWLGEVETDRETVLPAKDTGKPGSPTWMSSRDEVGIPRNALIGGSSSNDKKFLHVCRLTYQNNVYVGDTSGSDCQIGNVGPHNGQFKFGIYEILVNAGSASWRVNTEEGSNHGTSNPRRIIVGTRADGKPVSVCRVTNQTGTYIGWTADHECHIWNGSGARGQVSGVLKFEILYENGIDSATTASSRRRSP